jgi:hypothetical protein
VIDEAMVEGAQCLIDDVHAVHAEHGGELVIEHRVHMPHIHAENWGTLDAALWVPHLNRLYLWDYKHGHGLVDAKDNYQLIDYLAGLVAQLGINADIELVFRIVQPRAYRPTGPVDEWRGMLSEVQGVFNQLAHMASEALGPNPTFSTGKHCKHCKAVGRCEASRKAGYNYVDVVSNPYSIDTMDSASLAVERKIIAEGLILLTARAKAIDDDLVHRVKNGDTETGLALETSYGKKKWSVPAEQVIIYAKQFGVDVSKTVPITPTQAAKKAPKEVKAIFEEALKTITKRDARGLTLIQATDSISHRAFKKVR